MKNAWRARLLFVAIAVCAAALDQLSKQAVRAFLARRPGGAFTIIPGYLDIISSHNTGGAFSLFAGAPALFLVVPVVLIVAAVVFLFRSRQVGPAAATGLAMMLGGAVGNLVDRLRLGRVFDFIDCHVRNVHWPTYNAADIFIVAGTFLFAWTLLRGGMDSPESKPGKNINNKKKSKA